MINKNKKNNNNFEKLSPSQKRIFIARDVLAQLELGKYEAKSGVWVSSDDPRREDELFTKNEQKNNADLKEVFSKLKTCNVCALGGMFVSAVKTFNKIKVQDLDTSQDGFGYCEVCETEEECCSCFADEEDANINLQDIEDYMSKFFSLDQLKMIEIAFEKGHGGYCYDFSELESQAEDFASNIDDPTQRMKLIMQNIIANNGKFDPTKEVIKTITYSTPGFVD